MWVSKNVWTNSRATGDLRRHDAHRDIIVMRIRTSIFAPLVEINSKRIFYKSNDVRNISISGKFAWWSCDGIGSFLKSLNCMVIEIVHTPQCSKLILFLNHCPLSFSLLLSHPFSLYIFLSINTRIMQLTFVRSNQLPLLLRKILLHAGLWWENIKYIYIFNQISTLGLHSHMKSLITARSVPWLMKTWRRKEPGRQKSWYWCSYTCYPSTKRVKINVQG